MQPIHPQRGSNQFSYEMFQQPMIGQRQTPPVFYVESGLEIGSNKNMKGFYSPLNMEEKHIPKRQTGFHILDQEKGVFIKQKVEWVEAITGCETENKYYVYSLDEARDSKGHKLFKCEEKSDCCSRMCLSGDCRPFQMTISSLIQGEDNDGYEPFLLLDRPCKCTCLCFNRPEILVNSVEGGRNEYLGKIVDPFNYCNMELDVYDKDNEIRYVIEGSCCQLGIWCKWPFEACQTVDFEVKNSSSEVVSTLQKRTAGCLQSLLTDTDTFALNFPSGISSTEKALLLSAVLFLDFRHFETRANQNRDQQIGSI